MKYANPTLDCDIVMKGGVTSGVVYPSAVCRLAERYRFKNIGGTSAGAIAAACTAAAEYGRATGKPGFETLDELPQWLNGGTNLQDLFQPARSTARLFYIALKSLGAIDAKRKSARIIGAILQAYWFLAILCPLAIAVSYPWWGPFENIDFDRLAWIALLSAAITSAAVAAQMWVDLTRNIPDNDFGMCNGIDTTGKTAPLTVWLADRINAIAGIPPGDSSPLTFGDLWKPPQLNQPRNIPQPPEAIAFKDLKKSNPHEDHELPSPLDRAINLEMMTSCITFGHPYRLPVLSRALYIDLNHASKIFPKDICDWLEKWSTRPASQREALDFELVKPLVPLPSPAQLPILVAARMSLSFPILLSAVKLYAVNWTTSENKKADKAIEDLLDAPNAEALNRLRAMTPEQRKAADLVVAPEPCWLSDGGLTSNFPIQFFDAPLPLWPTFGIDLSAFSKGASESTDESRNVRIAEDNHGGTGSPWNPIDVVAHPSNAPSPSASQLRLVNFFAAIWDTTQNWVDNAQARMPGYKDRVVHVMLTRDEGGLNLTMPAPLRTKLIARGTAAGQQLIDHFAEPNPGTKTTWLNHRWVRYRTFMSVVAPLLQSFKRGYFSGQPTFAQLAARDETDPPPSYRWARHAQRDLAKGVNDALLCAADQLDASNQTLAERAPHPIPNLVTRP